MRTQDPLGNFYLERMCEERNEMKLFDSSTVLFWPTVLYIQGLHIEISFIIRKINAWLTNTISFTQIQKVQGQNGVHCDLHYRNEHTDPFLFKNQNTTTIYRVKITRGCPQ